MLHLSCRRFSSWIPFILYKRLASFLLYGGRFRLQWGRVSCHVGVCPSAQVPPLLSRGVNTLQRSWVIFIKIVQIFHFLLFIICKEFLLKLIVGLPLINVKNISQMFNIFNFSWRFALFFLYSSLSLRFSTQDHWNKCFIMNWLV